MRANEKQRKEKRVKCGEARGRLTKENKKKDLIEI